MNDKCECNCHYSESLCEECFNSPNFYKRHNFLLEEDLLSAPESMQERCDEVTRENFEAVEEANR